MGCYVKSQGYGDETYGVFYAKEINKKLTTCRCSYCLSMKSNLYTGSTRLKMYFFSFQIANSHSQKLWNWLND